MASLLAACDSSSNDSSSGGAGGASTAQTGSGKTGSGTGSGQGGGSGLAPNVLSTIPVDGATGVPTNTNASVTFDEPMDCSSLTTSSFTVVSGATPVAGTVICAKATAVFWPAAHLAVNSPFTATITTGAKSLGGVRLASSYQWSFTTGAVTSAGLPVNLGTSSKFAILAKAGVSTVPGSAITGNIGVSPAAADAITGFSLKADASNVFSTSAQVTGQVFAANYAVPTPANLTTAVGDMELAYTDAGARAPDVTELGAGNIGGLTLAPGVYKWGTGLMLPTDVTLNGSATDVWILQIAQNLTVSSGAKVHLTGGAVSKNVFWQVAGLVDVGTTAHLEGVIVTQTGITFQTGSSINGRLLAQTAVSLDHGTIVEPAP